MSKNKPELVTLTLLGIVAIIWGLNVIMIKYLSVIFPVIQLAAWRIGIATLCLVIFTFRFWRASLRSITLKSWVYILFIGLTSIFAHQTLIAKGLQLTSSSTGSLILALNPLTTLLLAMLFLGEKFVWRRFLGIGLGFFGVIMVIGIPSGETSLTGDFIMFLSMLAYVAGGLFIKKASEQVDVITITTLSHVAGSIILFITWLIFPGESIVYEASGFAYLVLFFSGSVATALGSTWWNMGIKKIGPSRTTMFLNLMPLSSLIFAVLLLNEKLHWIHGVSLFLIIVGIYLGSVKNSVKQDPSMHLPSSRQKPLSN